MTDETDQHDDVLDLTEDQQVDERQDEAPEEFHLELEGEEAHEETPAIREMRQRLRDQARELDGYRKQAAPKKVEVGTKPTIDSCDYDQDRFDAEYEAWTERKRQNERVENEAQESERVRNESFQRAASKYEAAKAKLPVKDYDKAEAAVRASFSPILQSAVVQYFEGDAPKIVAALGKYPNMLERVAAEPDTIKALLMLKDMQSKIRTGTEVTRKAPPPPEAETIQRGSAPISKQTQSKELAALEKEADRTGDYSKFFAARRAERRA